MQLKFHEKMMFFSGFYYRGFSINDLRFFSKLYEVKGLFG